MRHTLSVYLVLLAASSVLAFEGQTPAPPRPLAFPPAASGITVASDVEYGMSGTTRLAMDLYKPAMTPGAKVPVLVFFNRATGAERSERFYAAWARAAAAKGVIGVLPDLREGSEAGDFHILLSYLERHAAEHGIDSIAVYTGSGNVFTAFPVVQDPNLMAIKAAVTYYGTANVPQFRLDLPVLYVRAGLDRPSVNESISRLAALAVAQNAPLTLLNYADGHHGFELADDNDATRQVSGSRPAGGARGPPEGGSGCRDCVAEIDPAAVPPGLDGGGSRICRTPKSVGFSGFIRAPMIWSVRRRRVLT